MSARVEAIHRQYTSNFAGQPRATRDLSLLQAIIAEIDEALTDAEKITADGVDTLITGLEENRVLYANEAAEIQRVRVDPKAREQDELMVWLGVLAGRYQRFFANQSRISRDLGLLHEIAEDAERLSLRMEARSEPEFDEIMESLRARKKLYISEIAAVEGARRDAKPEHLAGHLASMANHQFSVYQSLFLGKSRLSRRPATLLRVVGNLQGIRAEMVGLRDGGLENDFNAKNIEIVNERMEFYQTELEAIQTAKGEADVAQLGSSLAEAANSIFSEYKDNFAGQDHASCDEELLSGLVEQLYDLARQMEDLQLFANMVENQKNLRVVLNNLRLYEREFASISEAKTE